MVPALFVAHGMPTLVLETNSYTKLLRNLGLLLPRPKGIAIFSAHWEHPVQMISSAPQLETMYDFFGFPEPLYELDYPAKGDLVLSMEIERLLSGEGIRCELNHRRGLDHGVWTVMKLLYPEADIPLVSLSVHPRLVPEEQYRIGKALLALREQGVMIIGSGGTVHNLSKLRWESEGADKWAVHFDRWLADKINVWDLESLFDYAQRAPYAQKAVPTQEHLAPLFICMGAADRNRSARLLHQQYQYGTMSLSAWMFK
ncbi:DODA-type extradiol aromatic ring-opening family dioxygenase [Paenibacillus sp. OAS669]|uniref:DODA-type extradiol aromatic ring-opening family dioxygenase n=1 Tax=Paenibacillus sp. OAS669 TaxID=2663821 RepID=UPI0017897872|nr:class III extradiol ring-cleavage dioxygenase [Paenibacillus sp. OAS669]MBE1446256.1 4,5-DOPA dioxygenase extradiol [Paenibacillus sp. OAS669]